MKPIFLYCLSLIICSYAHPYSSPSSALDCKLAGKVVPHGSSTRGPSPCTTCTCDNGMLDCAPVTCPTHYLHCPRQFLPANPAEGRCCHSCKKGMFPKREEEMERVCHDGEIRPKDCVACYCVDGKFDSKNCHYNPAMCLSQSMTNEQAIRQGSPVSVQVEQCEEGITKIFNCERCTCLSGQFKCVFDSSLCEGEDSEVLSRWMTDRLTVRANGVGAGDGVGSFLVQKIKQALEAKGTQVLSIQASPVGNNMQPETVIEMEYRLPDNSRS